MNKKLINSLLTFFSKIKSHPLALAAFILFLFFLNWFIVYRTNGTNNVFVHFFYFIIMLGAYCFGKWGGVYTGIVSGLLLGPVMPFNVAMDIKQLTITWEIRLVIFIIFGLIIGHLFDRLHKQRIHIYEMSTEIISALANTIEARDKYTRGHCSNVMVLAVALGKELKLSHKELIYIKWSSLVHDIGKIAVPEAILNKPDQLTKEEYAIIQQHPEVGAKIIEPIDNLSPIVPGIKFHHESLDGTGYPYGLTEKEIPLQAKIIAVADIWDALTTDRPYRKGLSKKIAAGILIDMSGNKLDPKLVNIFLKKIVKVQPMN